MLTLASTVIVGWNYKIAALVQVFPGLVAMQYNTALGFMALSLAGLGLISNRRTLLVTGGGATVLLGSAVIAEYMQGADPGIDTLFFVPWSRDLTPEVGRMALPSAIGFVMSGAALPFLAFRRSYAALGVMNSVTLSLSLAALVGYAFGSTYLVSSEYGTSMAVHTALAFFAYSIAMLGYAWTRDDSKTKGFPTWTPELSLSLVPVLFYAAATVIPETFITANLVAFALALIASSGLAYVLSNLLTVTVTMKGALMVATPSLFLIAFAGLIANVDHENELNQTSALHSALVTETSQHLLATVVQAESSAQSYLLTKDPVFITGFGEMVANSRRLSSDQVRLVARDPVQERSAVKISILVDERMKALAREMDAIQSGDAAAIAAVTMHRLGASRSDLFDELNVFAAEVSRSSIERGATLDHSWQKANKLLVAGTTAAILLAGLFSAAFSGGMTRRINTIRDNMGRLKQRRHLLPPIGGSDEIAQLDGNFHEMAYALDEVQREEALLREQARVRTAELQRFRSAMDASAEAIFLSDPRSGLILEANSTGLRMTGYSREELMKMGVAALTQISDESDRQLLLQQGASPAGVETTLVTNGGAVLDVELHIQHARVAEGWIDVSVIQDITEQKEAQRRLHQLAHYDALTGLPNRTLFFQNLRNILAQAKEQDLGVVFLSIGLDEFKLVNEAHGHAVGDRVLQAFADRVIRSIRMRDAASRLGSDEIGAVLVMEDENWQPTIVANRILEAIREPFEIEGEKLFITASIGMSIFPDDALDGETLLRHGQAAMHWAKDAARDAFQFYTARMNVEARSRAELLSALKLAIERQEFVLHYQPKARISSNQVSGVEALLRWERPGHGLVSPAVFIPILEESNLILQVGAWVIGQACRQISRWAESDIGPIQVAVNVAGRQFSDGSLTDEVTTALRETGISPALLEFELTESSLMLNTEHTISTLHSLRELGIRISIDDFGTGFSSLAYLRRFPIDRLKIDIAFVREITTNPDDAAIAIAIIQLAHSLKLDVVAEGVESESQLAYLKRHQCDYYQGYYFSRPLTLENLETFLRVKRDDADGRADDFAGDTILLVDDEPEINDTLGWLLEQEGYRVYRAGSATEGFELLAIHEIQVIICDQRMPGISGIEFFDRVKDLYPNPFRIILSGYTDSETILESINRGAIYRFHTKPVDFELLFANLRETFRHYWLLHGKRARDRQ